MASLDSLMLALAAAASPLLDMGRSMAKAPEEEVPAQPQAATTGGDGEKKVPEKRQKLEDTKATAPATDSEPKKRKSGKTKEELQPSAKKAK